MTPEDAVSEYHRVIAEYDARYGEDPLEKRRRQREAEQQERCQQEVRKIKQQAINHRAALRLQASDDWWQQHDQRVYACIKLWVEQWWEFQRRVLIDAVGQVFGEERSNRREAIAKIKERVIQLEATNSLEARFAELAHEVKRGYEIPQGELLEKIEKLQRQLDDPKRIADLDARFHELAERVGELENTNSLEARFAKLAHEVKRGTEMVPYSELLAKFEKLQRQIDDLERVADLDARFRELTERVGELEKTNILDPRFAELAHEAKRGLEMIPQGELPAKIEALQRHVDEPQSVADLDGLFRQLAERVGALEQTSSLEARFSQLANEVKRGSEIPQGELLEKIETLQRQIDDPKKVADLDSRFRELIERVGELEQTSSLEARFSKFADEVKRGSELPQSELLPRIDRLERQLDDLKRIPGQSGPQGPPGKDGKLPIVKVFQKDAVYYTGDVVICDGSTYQALRDTGQNVNHADWVCLARAGRDGSDGRTPNVCGTYDAGEKYEQLDIVALDGAAFIARRDNPGICPGDDWQLMSRQGRPGHRGETGGRGVRGEKGERGEPGATVVSWQLDRQRYRVSPLMSDGKVGPALELRALFQQYHAEADQ